MNVDSMGLTNPDHRCDLQALVTLCDKTEQDLRSCLNTLQFLAKRKKTISSLDLTGLQCGQKDISKSAFAMWQQLFLDKVCMPQA